MTDADLSHHTDNALTCKNAGRENKQDEEIRVIVKWALIVREIFMSRQA